MKRFNRDWLISVFKENWEAKALAFVLAVIIFYAIRSTIGNREVFMVPVEVKVGEGVAVIEQDPRVVKVTFEGSHTELRQLSKEPIEAVVSPPSSIKAGIISIRSRNISARRIARIVSIEPSEVRVRFDQESRVVMTIARPILKGAPLRGTAEIDYKPRTVEVAGPGAQLTDLLAKGYEIQTAPIDIEGKMQSFSQVLKLLPPEDVVISSMDPSTVEVRVTIKAKVNLTEVPDIPVIPVHVSGCDTSYSFTPSNVVVRLAGSGEILKKITGESLMALADCRGLEPGEHEVHVDVFLKPGIVLESVDAVPADVTVLVQSLRASSITGRTDRAESADL